LLWDISQVRRSLSAYDSQRRSGNYLAAQLAESYVAAARSALAGTASSHQRLNQLAMAAAARGHRALELLNLGLAARTGSHGGQQAPAALPELGWSTDVGFGAQLEAGAARPPRQDAAEHASADAQRILEEL